jgi:ATP-dependent RNA helicase DDX24/MAK5
VVATPGRLWEMISGGHAPYVANLSSVAFLVLDEADRMVEAGHFRELTLIIDALLRGAFLPH